MRRQLDGLHSRYNRALVEQAALAGALKPLARRLSIRRREPRAQLLADRMNAIAEETERGWSAPARGERLCADARGARRPAGGGPRRGPARFGRRAPPRRARAAAQRSLRRAGDVFARRGDTTTVSGPSELLEAINAAGRKGVAFQRYKGLGEMNKDQLWETTLDREARTLLQVKIREVDEADDIFVKLMGDIVEPRREFIQDNALSVANLDV